MPSRLTPDILVRVLGPWSAQKGPLYKSLARALRLAIEQEELRPGTQLPSERALATALAVSRTTVMSAYDQLRQHDLIVSRQGSGSYVKSWRQHRWSLSKSDRIPLSIHAAVPDDGDSTPDFIEFAVAAPSADLIPPEVWSDATKHFEESADHHGYEVFGIPQLRSGVAAHLSESGLPSSAEDILITSGAQEAIMLAAALLVRPGDRVLIEDPTWIGAIDAFRTAGAELISVPLDSDGLVVRACRSATEVGAVPAGVLYISPSFHNPSGLMMSELRRRELAGMVQDLGILVIEDNTLSDLFLASPPPAPIAPRVKDPVITIGSMSKLFWGGLRIGWIRTSEELISRLARLKLVFDHGSSIPSQLLAAALLERVHEVRDARRQQLQERLDLLSESLRERIPDWTWSPPAGGLSIWVQMSYGNSLEFSQFARQFGVGLIPGTMASPAIGCGDRLRIPYVHEVSTLEIGVERLANAWEAYRKLVSRRELARSIV